MRYGILMLVLLWTSPLLAAETIEVVPGDIGSVSYPSDYGNVTVRAGTLPPISKWGTKTAPPLSVADAVASARAKLPRLQDTEWELSDVALLNFGNYYGHGEWYYVVSFYNVTDLKKDGKFYNVIKRYNSVVLLDGTVLAPTAGNPATEAAGPGIDQLRRRPRRRDREWMSAPSRAPV